ncbi:hypothetical protein [Eisenbergiella porci]|uniref:hypothetical protein n=1 Tax=Eisenbergiella porci TaxID=2652274 RepID=UPI002A8390CD|nr:hypothetical protein [Eisenbergiella porci]
MNDISEKKLFKIFLKFKSEEILNPLWDNEKDTCLTGEKWGFSALDMVVLYFEIEKEFNVEIEPSIVLDYGFSTINKILFLLKRMEVRV